MNPAGRECSISTIERLLDLDMNISRSTNSELLEKSSQLTRESLQQGKSLDVAIYATLFYFQNTQNLSKLELERLQSWLQKNFIAAVKPSKCPTFTNWIKRFKFQSLTLPWAIVIASIILSLAVFFWAKTIESRLEMKSTPSNSRYHFY